MIPMKNKPKHSKIPLKRKKEGNDNVLTKVQVGLGWQEGSDNLDLDIMAFLVDADGKCRDDHDMVLGYADDTFLRSRCGSLVHFGDAKEGNDGDGDCETIEIDLTKVPKYVSSIAFVVAIAYAGEDNNDYDFSMVNEAYVKVVNSISKSELLRFDLTEELGMEHCVLFAELSRGESEWEFRPLDECEDSGFGGFCTRFGLTTE